jgi:hypothetical protein
MPASAPPLGLLRAAALAATTFLSASVPASSAAADSEGAPGAGSSSLSSPAASSIGTLSPYTPFAVAASSVSTVALAVGGDRQAAGPSFGARCELAYDTRPREVAAAASLSSSSSSTSSSSTKEELSLVASLFNSCVSYESDGGFIYEICIGGKVRQRGRNSDPSVFDYTVGTYDEAATARRRGGGGSSSSNVLLYTRGDKCGDPDPLRRAEVRLHCGPTFAVLRAEEPETCAYRFDVSHKSLCDRPGAFPEYVPPPVSQYAGGGGGGGAGNGGDEAPAPLDLVGALPADAAAAVRGREGLLHEAAARAAADAAERETHASSGLSEADVAGVGGKTIGLDDRERHGGHWVGIKPGADAGGGLGSASWALDLHPTVGAAAQASLDVDGDGADEAEGERLRAAAAAVRSWTCTALATDDLRKGTEGPTPGATSSPLAFGRLSLRMSTPLLLKQPLADDGAGGSSSVRAVARSSNRQRLPVRVERVPELEGEEGTGGSVLLTVDAEDIDGQNVDVAFISLTVGDGGDGGEE